ncbi:hypothetical protein [Candidatus Laterigemmans baculatus]|nr:hypothetical protein [Candidatus Laterigemmans baculatus]
MGKVLSTAGFLLMLSLSIAILYQQTRRYLRAKRHPEPAADEAEEV